MRMSGLKAWSFLALIACSGAAHALTIPLTNTGPGPTLYGATADVGTFGQTIPPGNALFINAWDFTLGDPTATVNVTVTDSNVASDSYYLLYQGLTLISSFPVKTSTGVDDTFSLTGGSYELLIGGIPANGATYSGTVSVLPATVPLPSAAWLLLSGAAGILALARRSTAV